MATVWVPYGCRTQPAPPTRWMLCPRMQLRARSCVTPPPIASTPLCGPVLRTYVATGHPPVVAPSGASMTLSWSASGGELVPGSSSAEVAWKAPQAARKLHGGGFSAAHLSGHGVQGVTINVQAPTPTPAPTSTPTPTPLPKPTDVPTVVPAATAIAAAAVAAAAPAVSYSPSVGLYPFGYGVQVHAISNDHGPIIGAVTGMGFGWMKQQIEWSVYEPSKGNYQWGELDRLVNDASSAGVKLLFSVLRSPSWLTLRPAGRRATATIWVTSWQPWLALQGKGAGLRGLERREPGSGMVGHPSRLRATWTFCVRSTRASSLRTRTLSS